MQEYLPACKIVTTHGVRGEMKALPLCDGAAFLSGFKTLYATADGAGPRRLLGVRAQGNMLLVRLEGVADMDAARALVGQVFYIDRADAKLPRGHYFQADLLGCRLIDAESGRDYGEITQVSHPGAQDIYTVACPDGSTALFPAVKPFLVKICIEDRKVLVSPIPGMFGEAENGDQV